jgi:hypothetical protein
MNKIITQKLKKFNYKWLLKIAKKYSQIKSLHKYLIRPQYQINFKILIITKHIDCLIIKKHSIILKKHIYKVNNKSNWINKRNKEKKRIKNYREI